jgi:predicted transposase/invertase (TIGR01784 family)
VSLKAISNPFNTFNNKNQIFFTFTKTQSRIKTNKYEEYLRHQMSEMATMKEIESAEQKGRKEGKIEIARNLLSMKLDVDTISKATGLKNEEIVVLKNQKK